VLLKIWIAAFYSISRSNLMMFIGI